MNIRIIFHLSKNKIHIVSKLLADSACHVITKILSQLFISLFMSVVVRSWADLKVGREFHYEINDCVCKLFCPNSPAQGKHKKQPLEISCSLLQLRPRRPISCIHTCHFGVWQILKKPCISSSCHNRSLLANLLLILRKKFSEFVYLIILFVRAIPSKVTAIIIINVRAGQMSW